MRIHASDGPRKPHRFARAARRPPGVRIALPPVLAFVAIYATALPAHSQDQYCGIYCVYAGQSIFDGDASFEALLEPEFVGPQGSTLNDLAAACDAMELHSQAFWGMSSWDLRLADRPVILHFRSHRGTKLFQHWVLYLGDEGGRAWILDPNSGEQQMSYAEVMANWDGAGVIVSDDRWSIPTWRLAGILLRLIPFVALGLTIGGIASIARRTTAARRLVAPRAALACVSVGVLAGLFIAGTLLDSLLPEGVLRNPAQAAAIASLYDARQFPTVSVGDVEGYIAAQATGEGKAAFLDARFAEDYSAGHLPGAINLPISASLAVEEEAVSALDIHEPVIVYCQSESCPFSDMIARRLQGRGFSDVKIFVDGWRGWVEASAAGDP